jgi:hypothetical protein
MPWPMNAAQALFAPGSGSSALREAQSGPGFHQAKLGRWTGWDSISPMDFPKTGPKYSVS